MNNIINVSVLDNPFLVKTNQFVRDTFIWKGNYEGEQIKYSMSYKTVRGLSRIETLKLIHAK